MKLVELADYLEGRLILAEGCDSQIELTGVSPIEAAAEGKVSFINSKEYEKFIAQTKASCLITSVDRPDAPCSQIVVEDAYVAFAAASSRFATVIQTMTGISDKAFVSESARVSEQATLYPHVFIDEDATVAEGAVLYPGVYIGPGASVGKNSVLRANVVVEHQCHIGEECLLHGGVVVGADGFGFAPNIKKGKIEKIPQIGNVIVEDHVELGAGCSVDRATMGSTVIGEGTKIDSFTQVGHNVRMGKHNIMCGAAAMAGSSSTEDFVVIGGASNVSNHVHLKKGVRVAAKSVVTKNLNEPGDYCGYPAIPISDWRKQIVNVRRIPKILERIKALTKSKSQDP